MAPVHATGSEAIVVLRTKVDPQPSLWETLLPPEFNALPSGLALIDQLLDDPAFFEPFVPHFDPGIGRPSIPIETYLRMMFLRFRYRLGFDTLCKEVADSFSWRRFCRIGLSDPVPHPTTLFKITARCGEEAVKALNEALLEKAVASRLVKTDKLRADTTVVSANVSYPTDSSLLSKGVGKLAKTVQALKALGLAPRCRFGNRTRSIRRRVHEIATWLRRRSDQAKEEVFALNAEMARIAEALDQRGAGSGPICSPDTPGWSGAPAGKGVACRLGSDDFCSRAHRLPDADATFRRGARRSDESGVVNDTDARPIRKGRLDRPVEFGYKAQIVDNSDGIVVDHNVVISNPVDAPMLVPGLKRVTALIGRITSAVTADRGYGDPAVEDELHAMGVKMVAIPRRGRPSKQPQQIERSRGFRRLVKWRTGAEGHISHLKRSFRFDRTLLDGIDGARMWCGWGVLAHNAVKIAALAE